MRLAETPVYKIVIRVPKGLTNAPISHPSHIHTHMLLLMSVVLFCLAVFCAGDRLSISDWLC